MTAFFNEHQAEADFIDNAIACSQLFFRSGFPAAHVIDNIRERKRDLKEIQTFSGDRGKLNI